MDKEQAKNSLRAMASALVGTPVGKEYGEIIAVIESLEQQVEELKGQLREVQEIYAGMGGLIPQTAPEGYQQRIIRQMYEAATPADQGQKEAALSPNPSAVAEAKCPTCNGNKKLFWQEDGLLLTKACPACAPKDRAEPPKCACGEEDAVCDGPFMAGIQGLSEVCAGSLLNGTMCGHARACHAPATAVGGKV